MDKKRKTGRYKICQIIGEGATSTVYRALDTLENKVVAIKVFSNRDTNLSQNKMANECSILKLMNSEHIVQFKRVITPNSYVLEHCDCNLITFLNDHELDLKGIKKIVRMILLGVHEIHLKNIIHRDLKLGNILVKEDAVKICDFGLSCFKDENDFSYCGTKDYLAPEVENLKNCCNNVDKHNMPLGSKNVNINSQNEHPHYENNTDKKCYYNEKIDIYAVGIIYKILLSRKKDIDISELDVENEVKDLILQMTHSNPNKRLSAYDAISHPSFNELFVCVPDFRLLKDCFKTTKYGKIFKSSKLSNQLYSRTQHKVGIQFFCLAEENELILEAGDEDVFSFNVFLNGQKLDLKMLNNTILKYYNYLSTYFKLVCDKTVKFQDKEGVFTYCLTISNIGILECPDFRVRKDGTSYDICYFTPSLNNNGNRTSRDPSLGHTINNEIHYNKTNKIPPEVKILFEKFENKVFPCKSLLSVDHPSSHNISLYPEDLYKKHQYCSGIGWCIKEGLKFTILLNDGAKICVFIEDFSITVNDCEKISIDKADFKILETVNKFIKKYV